MLSPIHQEKTDEINLKIAANVFCEANEERRRTFRMFCDTDFFTFKRLKGINFHKKKQQQLPNVNG